MALAGRAAFTSLFSCRSAVIAMVHVQALPGTPQHCLPLERIVERACAEAELYQQCGVDGILVENMHDLPYMRGKVEPEIVASMTRVCSEIKQAVKDIPMGIQILAGANVESLAVAHACGAHFVRAEGFVFSHVADEGWMDSCAGELLRYRKAIGADAVFILTDIQKKHCSHAVTADLDVCEVAKAAQFFLSDGVILTGQATGSPANALEIAKVKSVVTIPIIVGSGVTEQNVEDYLGADAMIIGSHFKAQGAWYNSIERSRVTNFMQRINTLVGKQPPSVV